jgi:hypothetical protein
MQIWLDSIDIATIKHAVDLYSTFTSTLPTEKKNLIRKRT